MKKTYSTPVIDIEKFDVVDIITESVQVTTAGAAEATDGNYTYAVGVEW